MPGMIAALSSVLSLVCLTSTPGQQRKPATPPKKPIVFAVIVGVSQYKEGALSHATKRAKEVQAAILETFPSAKCHPLSDAPPNGTPVEQTPLIQTIGMIHPDIICISRQLNSTVDLSYACWVAVSIDINKKSMVFVEG